MSLSFAMVALLMAQGSAPVPDVAFEELARGQNEAAIERLEDNAALDSDDPARLINLGVAHAREGQVKKARELFGMALRSDTRVPLETATGEWVDSRTLARMALRTLDDGGFASGARMASR